MTCQCQSNSEIVTCVSLSSAVEGRPEACQPDMASEGIIYLSTPISQQLRKNMTAIMLIGLILQSCLTPQGSSELIGWIGHKCRWVNVSFGVILLGVISLLTTYITLLEIHALLAFSPRAGTKFQSLHSLHLRPSVFGEYI